MGKCLSDFLLWKKLMILSFCNASHGTTQLILLIIKLANIEHYVWVDMINELKAVLGWNDAIKHGNRWRRLNGAKAENDVT